MKLSGKTALVTGAAKRVGRECALHLAAAGADILLHYHMSEAAAADTASEIRALGRRCTLLRANLCDAGEVDELASSALTAHGEPPAVLVNCASDFRRVKLAEINLAQDWDAMLAVNLRAPFQLARALGLAMAKGNGGKIINIADAAIHRPYRHHLPYFVSKAALEAMTRLLALELAPKVQVNCVGPGTVIFNDDQSPALRQAILNEIPLGRIGSPGDIARMVLYLVEHGDFITGAFLPVDGGVAIPG